VLGRKRGGLAQRPVVDDSIENTFYREHILYVIPVVDHCSLGHDLSELIFCHEHLRQLEASCVVHVHVHVSQHG